MLEVIEAYDSMAWQSSLSTLFQVAWLLFSASCILVSVRSSNAHHAQTSFASGATAEKMGKLNKRQLDSIVKSAIINVSGVSQPAAVSRNLRNKGA